MPGYSPTFKRTALAKSAGLIVGLIGFFATRAVMPDADPLLAWGVLALYLSIGGIVGLTGVASRVPFFNLSVPPALRGGMMGAWFTALVVLFGYPALEEALASNTLVPAVFSNPWWMLLDGAVFGALLDVVLSRAIRDVPEVYATA